jgi:putative restriction endonuclease
VTHWVGSISYEQRDNWDTCKRESLFGSNTIAALGVRAGDELFIWGSRQGWLARCRATADARRPRGIEEVPWPEPQRYTALIPIEVLDEPATPISMSGNEIEQTVGIGTIQLPRFPRVDLRHAEHLTVLLSEDYRSHSEVAGRRRLQEPPAELSADDPLLNSLDELRVDRQLGRPAPYQQLVLLWAISETMRGGDRLRPFSSASGELRTLLTPFAVGETAPDPELPWFALRKSSWWWMSPQPDGPVGRGGRDFVRTEDPVGGLTSEVYRRIRNDDTFRAEAIEKLTAVLSGHPSLAVTLESLFPAPVAPSRDGAAIDVLRGLVGRRLTTVTGQVNEILRAEPPNVIVATDRSPHGQPVPIADVQRALDLLRRDGAVTIDVPTLGHRSSFIGAVLTARADVTVTGSPPVVSLLDAHGTGAPGHTPGGLDTAPAWEIARQAGRPDAEVTPRPGHATDRYFGELPGLPVGSGWATRAEVARAGVHRPPQGGISGTRADGADSIVVSGGYEDDSDDGDEILYTGAGGNDPVTGKQVADQTLDQPGNAGLVTSQNQGLPVRVVRGAKGAPAHSPASGYRYDGLYRVADHWSKIGKSGFRVWQFRLVRLSDPDAAPYVPDVNVPAGRQRPKTSQGVTTRVVRDTRVSRYVKKLYGDACQVCGVRLEIPGGAVSEGAHVRALGRPHFGPDSVDNVLCLCPNHHTLFDEGGIYVGDDLRVHDHQGAIIGTLAKHAKHPIDVEHLRSHRDRWGY